MTDRILAGKCYCGAVQYEVADAFLYAMNCHCSNCRRTTGSAFKPFAGIEREKLTLTQGADGLLVYGGDKAHDAHCGSCGSLLYSRGPRRRLRPRRHGQPGDEPTIRPTHHIFVGSKAAWFTITDDLPQYEGHVTR